jgi:hypothetical protein
MEKDTLVSVVSWSLTSQHKMYLLPTKQKKTWWLVAWCVVQFQPPTIFKKWVLRSVQAHCVAFVMLGEDLFLCPPAIDFYFESMSFRISKHHSPKWWFPLPACLRTDVQMYT